MQHTTPLKGLDKHIPVRPPHLVDVEFDCVRVVDGRIEQQWVALGLQKLTQFGHQVQLGAVVRQGHRREKSIARISRVISLHMLRGSGQQVVAYMP